MQYTVACRPDALDMPRFENLLFDLDPSALADLDSVGRVLRLSTLLDAEDTAIVLSANGPAVSPDQVQPVPSECCGGCGG